VHGHAPRDTPFDTLAFVVSGAEVTDRFRARAVGTVLAREPASRHGCANSRHQMEMVLSASLYGV
jgi:hypothetical protein